MDDCCLTIARTKGPIFGIFHLVLPPRSARCTLWVLEASKELCVAYCMFDKLFEIETEKVSILQLES